MKKKVVYQKCRIVYRIDDEHEIVYGLKKGLYKIKLTRMVMLSKQDIQINPG